MNALDKMWASSQARPSSPTISLLRLPVAHSSTAHRRRHSGSRPASSVAKLAVLVVISIVLFVLTHGVYQRPLARLHGSTSADVLLAGKHHYFHFHNEEAEKLQAHTTYHTLGPEQATDHTTGPQNTPTPTTAHKKPCSVYIYDPVTEIQDAPELFKDVLKCNINDTAVWPFGQPGHGVDGQATSPHHHCQNANIHYIISTLKDSPLRVHDINEADLIYVDWHCYFMKWLSGVYSEDLQQNSHVGRLAMRYVYAHLKSHPVWKATGGRNFVFTLPHPSLVTLFDMCHEMDEPVLLVVEKSMRCENDAQARRLAEQTTIMPYAAVADNQINSSTTSRDRLLFYAGGCSADPGRSFGQHQRSYIVSELKKLNESSVLAQCSCGQCPGYIPHEELPTYMQTSRYCLVQPGDTQSSRRLSEAIINGCIPVLIGPLYHTLPLGRKLDWNSFVVFFDLDDPTVPFEPSSEERRLWTPDIEIEVTIKVNYVREILQELKGINDTMLAAKQAALHQVQSMFMYDADKTVPLGSPSAADVIVSDVCGLWSKVTPSRAEPQAT